MIGIVGCEVIVECVFWRFGRPICSHEITSYGWCTIATGCCIPYSMDSFIRTVENFQKLFKKKTIRIVQAVFLVFHIFRRSIRFHDEKKQLEISREIRSKREMRNEKMNLEID